MRKSLIRFGIIMAFLIMTGFPVLHNKKAPAQICSDGGCDPRSMVTVCLISGNGNTRTTITVGVAGARKLYELGMVTLGSCPDDSPSSSAEIASADQLCDVPCLEGYMTCLENCDLDAATYEICARTCKERINLSRDAKTKRPEEELNATDWFKRGMALGLAKRHREEIDAYRQALKMNPVYVDAYYHLILSYLMLGDKDSALKEYHVLKELDVQKAKILYEKAILRALSSQYGKNQLRDVAERKIDGENTLINKLNNDDQYESRTIYTIQAGSFIKIERALKQFEYLIEELNEKECNNLRVEKVEKFYSVRIGKYDDYASAKKFLDEIRPQHSTALILKAYMKNDRIIKLYERPVSLIH